jgi:murein DD-endopeptidase MepM/ murein hydrolase activator NlpD
MKALLTFFIAIFLFAGARAQDTLFTQACLPLRNLSPTSPFGFRIHPVTGKYAFHAGIDLRARSDTVFAVLPGSIEFGYNPFLGVYLILTDGDLQIIYGHLSQVFVVTGDSVTPGMPMAVTGATGRVTGEHLHFAVRYGRRYIDPLLFLHALINRSRSP